jgi:multidrug efflux system outer membrane protein
VDVARTAAYPSISLTASLGSSSTKLSDLFSGPAFVWSVGAAVAQTLFDGGRREAQTEAARAARQLALADWQASLAQAFGDVRDALQAQTGTRASAMAQRERIAALERVLALARSRLRNGVSSQLEVLDAERSLLAAQSALVIAEQGQRTALVDLYKALGGGWQADVKQP